MATDFKSALERELKHIKQQNGLSDDKAFLVWFVTSILEIDEDSALEAIAVEGANDKGIDFFYVDDEEGRVFIGQGKHSRDLKYSAKERELSALESSLNWLSNPEALRREGRPELAQAAEDYLQAVQDGYGIELLFVYAGPKAVNIEKKASVYNQNSEHVARRRQVRVYDAGLLQDLWDEIQGGRRRIGEDSIAVTCCCETSGQFGEALIATVPGSELVRLYKSHNDRLFDRNVRLFLGARKGSVNAGLAATINDPDDRANFWAYNNGLTIICDSYKVRSGKVKLKNFSIVNGCQTVVSLAEHNGTAPEVTVLARCIAAPAAIVDNVIRYTNSQNSIRTWDIASQNKTQRRLKADFDRLPKPWIYMTRRGDRPSGALGKYREDGKLRQMQIDQVGQVMAAFQGRPVLAYKQKAFIFSRNHDDVFPADTKVTHVLFAWVASEVAQDLVRRHMKDDPDQAKVLKKGGTLFAIAVMAEILKARNGATYLTGLKPENIDSKKMRDRLRKYAEYATLVYFNAFTDEASVQSLEYNTLVRQPEFYDKVLKRSLRAYRKDALSPTWLDGALPKVNA